TLCVITVFAEFIAPYDYDEDNRENPYQPPTKIHCIDAGGRFHFIPFVYTSDKYLSENYERIYTESTAKHYSLRLFPKGDAYHLWGVIKWDRHLFGVGESAKMYLCGTDARGRDLFSRIVHGGRISLSIGIIGVFIAMVLGTIIGGLAGYFGGIVDQCIMRCAELFMMIPSFYLLLAIRASLPPDLSSAHVYFFVTCLLSLIGWAGLARIIRGMVLSLKEQDFVLAARLLGTNHFNVIVKHLLPHTTSYLLVAMSISIPGYILAESALSLLGLGIQEPFVSWGMLLSDALSIAQLKFHVWMLFPGVFIFITVFCCNVLGDSLRDVMDPLTKMKL
ncbi:MAG: ABC transporter permease, partial [Candidatus Omnitrophota bacterium]